MSDGCPDDRIVRADSNDEAAQALTTGEAHLVARTAWMWARQGDAGAVDMLVIDAARQTSLANTLNGAVVVAHAGGRRLPIAMQPPCRKRDRFCVDPYRALSPRAEAERERG